LYVKFKIIDMKTNGNDPGNPIPMDRALSFTDNPEYGLGLTKREHFAMTQMAALAGRGEYGYSDAEGDAEEAVRRADALIKALGKEAPSE